MPNEDFSIKTGVEVDDGGVSQLEDLAKSLINIATSLEKFKTSKVNIDTSGLKNVQKEIDNTKNKINDLKKLIGKNSKNGSNKGTTSSIEKVANNTFNAIDPDIYDQINKSLDNAASAAEKIKDALAGDTQSGLLVQINEMLSKTDELQNLADILKTNKNELDRLAKTSGVKKNKDAISSSTSIKTPKYTTDRSYVGDYKTLADNEAFTQVLKTFRGNTQEAKNALKERETITNRVNKQAPHNSAEINVKQKYDDLSKSVTDNINKYQDRIKSAYAAFDKIKSDKSGIAGIGDVFASSEEQINKWAAAVAKGKMGIDEFEKKVNGLNGSVGSIGKIIDPSSITDAKAELQSYLKELTGIHDISFSGFTEKNGLVSLKGTFKDSAGEAQTLAVQLNTLNGQIKNLGTSIKPVESGISKFFSGWKEKMVNLAQYLTSFQAMSQIWNTFKQGLEVVKEFDTALTEMRKVSDEPISKLKEFQKESFDMAKSVGTTALQIQNSTADFQRLGESFSDAKQSAVNANKLLNVSEFDNIDDATSALISMKAAYSEVAESDLVDKVNQVGEMIVPKHMVTCGEFLYSL